MYRDLRVYLFMFNLKVFQVICYKKEEWQSKRQKRKEKLKCHVVFATTKEEAV